MRGIGHATHTLANLQVSARTYEEIAELLRKAGYDHCFLPDEDGMISMQGIGITRPKADDMALRLKKAREDAGLTEKEAARKTFTALKSLTEYESGGMRPQARTLKQLAHLYNVSVGWLETGV
jgi:DNA-binding XRE family transcriptional regulator